MNVKLVNTAAEVILAALTQNQTAAGIATALDSVGLLLTPEKAADLTAFEKLGIDAPADRALMRCEREPHPSWLSDSADVLERDRACPWCRITELERAAVEGRAALAAFCFDLDDPGSAALGALYLLQQATIGIGTLDPGETLPTVYRASHDSIPMGLYITAAAAREHCESEERRSWSTSEKPTFDWIEDEEDGVAEMTTFVGGEECTTGYVVEALEVASEYDEEADE
ncbi:hypothetical protein ABZ235_30575 [Streptomyces canus]|uniref:hypothetical protein n=1 Tax=Streptomyces canus TaxID=58343 RepID=UPI0033A3AE96